MSNARSQMIQGDIAKIPGLLANAGVEVPTAFAEGLKRAGWGVRYPDLPSLTEISKAATHDEFMTAATAYARAKADRAALAAVEGELMGTRLPIAQAAFHAAKPELIETLIERWNTVAAKFEPLAKALPDLGRVSMWSLSVDAATTFVQARELADELRAVDAALDAVTGGTNSGYAEENRVCKIAEHRDYDLMKDAIHRNHADKQGTGAPLAPYLAPVALGARLRRLTPKDAEAHRKELAEAEKKDAPAEHSGIRRMGH